MKMRKLTSIKFDYDAFSSKHKSNQFNIKEEFSVDLNNVTIIRWTYESMEC
jgi:hypothetical protein